MKSCQVILLQYIRECLMNPLLMNVPSLRRKLYGCQEDSGERHTEQGAYGKGPA